jgi:hypothetical protein
MPRRPALSEKIEWPEHKFSTVICHNDGNDGQVDKTSDKALRLDSIFAQSDDRSPPEENLEDSGYGEFTITVEDCSDSHTPTGRESSTPPCRYPKCLLGPVEELLIQALTTPLDATFSTAGVANLTGSVHTPDFHAIAHGGFSDIHYGEWECGTSTDDGYHKITIRPVGV